MKSNKVLVIDHFDSFVHNLVDDFARLGAEPTVVRSTIGLDELSARVAELAPKLVVLSPGPGRPADAGVMPAFLRAHPRTPVLGVCLGLQVLAEVCGGRVERAPAPFHGRPDTVAHEGDALFAGVAQRFRAGRYHSLHVVATGPNLRVIARLPGDGAGGCVMAVRHIQRPWVGLQFHPESALTPEGPILIANALAGALEAPVAAIHGATP